MNLIYTQVPAKLREFMTGIPSWGVPQKITQQELAALGYKSSNDRTILGVLKALEVVNNEGRPTENWQALRDRENARPLLAHLIRNAYSELFAVYPNAQSISDTQLKNFFSSRSKAGERAVQMTIATFKALVSLASFDEEAIIPASYTEMSTSEPKALVQVVRKGAPSRAPLTLSLNFNIDGSATPETVQAIFAGLKDLASGENETN